MQPRTRNERKQQLPNYLNEEQLLQELKHQAQQKQKQKQFEELQEKDQLLKHMQNYQMGGEENLELEEFLSRKLTELKRENDNLGNENYQMYNQLAQQQIPQEHPNYDLLPPKQQSYQNQSKTQSEIEREKRLKLRQEERQRRLLGIQASVYDQNAVTASAQEQIQFSQQQQQQYQQQQSQPQPQQIQCIHQQAPSPMPQTKQNIKQNSSNISSILHGSSEKQSVDQIKIGGNKDILSNYIITESDKQFLKEDIKQQQPPTTTAISSKDKQLKYKQELDQQIAQKRTRIQSAHPYYPQQQQQQQGVEAPQVRLGGGVLPNQSQDESLKKLEDLEKKRKYADELKKQMQEKKQPQPVIRNNQVLNYQNSIPQSYNENQIIYQDQGLRENNQNYSNGAALQMNFPSNANQSNDPEKEKASQLEKKREYREALLQQMQEQQQQKNEVKQRNITSARVQTQNSLPLQNQNYSEFLQQQMQIETPQPLQTENRKLCKKITKQFDDEDQIIKKQIQQQEYQEELKKQIAEQNSKKELEKQKLKQEEERIEMQLELQRQQMREQLLQQKEDQNQKVSRRKRVNNQFINQNLETSEQIALKEVKQSELTKQSNYFSQPQQQQLQIDLQTQNLSQNLIPENYSQNLIPSTQYTQQQQQQQQQQFPIQQQYPPYQNFPMQQNQITQQQFWPNQAADQIQSMSNQIVQQKVNLELQIQKEALNNLQSQMQQLVDMYKNQITDIMGQKGTTDQQINQLKQMMEDKFNNPYSFSEMNSLLGLNNQQQQSQLLYQQHQFQQQQQQQQQQQIQQNNSKKYWSKQQAPTQQLLSVAQETPFKNNQSSILQQSLLPSSSDYVQPESNIMKQSYQKDLLLFEKLTKNKESFAKQFEQLQQKEQLLNQSINENQELLRKSQHPDLVQKQNESLSIPKDIDQKLSKVVNADYSYFDQKRKQKQTEKQFDQLKEALLSEESEEEIDQSFEAANISEIKKQEHEVKLGVAQFSNDQNSLVLQDEENVDQQNIQKFIESQVNEVNEINDDDYYEDQEINNRSELNMKELDKQIMQEFNDVRKSGKPLLDEELKAKLEQLSVHGSAEKEKPLLSQQYQQQNMQQEQKKNYGKPKTFDIFGQIEKQNSYMLTKNKEKQEQIITRLDKFIEEALVEVGGDYQQDDLDNNQGSDDYDEEEEIIETQELYQQVQSIEQRNKLAFKDARKSCESQRYQEDNQENY